MEKLILSQGGERPVVINNKESATESQSLKPQAELPLRESSGP